MALRVSPGDLKKLFDQVEKQGQIVGHATESEDRTTAVLDTDAGIKNLTTFRDSLRTMLAKSSVSVKAQALATTAAESEQQAILS